MKNLTELKIAYEIVGSTSVDKYGTPMWSDKDLQWAKEVIRWFKNLYRKARRMTGSWCCRIKLLYKELRDELFNKYIKPRILHKKIDKFYKILFTNGIYITLDRMNPLETLKTSKINELNKLIYLINN